MYSETTRSINVTVKPFYLEDQSSPAEDHYVWAYHVRIENHGEETVQLRRRHWQITDGRGQLQEVRGPGVVGEQPVLGPGRKLRIHQRHAAADAVRHHGRQLRDGDARRRELSRCASRPSRSTARISRSGSTERRPRASSRVRAPYHPRIRKERDLMSHVLAPPLSAPQSALRRRAAPHPGRAAPRPRRRSAP